MSKVRVETFREANSDGPTATPRTIRADHHDQRPPLGVGGADRPQVCHSGTTTTVHGPVSPNRASRAACEAGWTNSHRRTPDDLLVEALLALPARTAERQEP